MLLTLFCAIDDFRKAFSRCWRRFLLTHGHSGAVLRTHPNNPCRFGVQGSGLRGLRRGSPQPRALSPQPTRVLG